MKHLKHFLNVIILVALAACGGGGYNSQPAGNTPPPIGGIGRTGLALGPITTFGSIVVNGVRYETGSAVFTVNDVAGTQNDLRVGQVVTVKGTIDNNGTTGTASEVNFDDNVKGPVESIDLVASEMLVLGQTVLIRPETSFDDSISPSSLAGLSVGDIVEVSGQVDAFGRIAATRIELKPAATQFEVHGFVSGLDTANFRFNINALVVDYSAATLDNFPGGVVSEGDFVEAKGAALGAGGELLASKVELEAPLLGGAAGDRLEIEGFITRFVSAQDFDVAGFPVTTSANTVFAGGSATDLGLNIKVEAEGDLNSNGVLVATKIDIRRAKAVRATATVDSVSTANNSLVMLGITVTVDALTRLEDKSDADVRPLTLADLNTGDYLEVRGDESPASSGRIRATILERDDPDNETILQGFVTAVSEPELTILGVTIATNGSTIFRNVNDGLISSTEFFSQVAPNSLVKAKGTETSATTISAQEVEFELEL